MSYSTEELSNMYSFADAVHVVQSILAENEEKLNQYRESKSWVSFEEHELRLHGIEIVLDALTSEVRLNHHIEQWEKSQEPEIRPSAAEQFDSFEIGQEFYPTAGEDSTYRFVKTGENSLVQIHQASGKANVYSDALARENFAHWYDCPANLIPIERN